MYPILHAPLKPCLPTMMVQTTDYGHTKTKSLILCGPKNSNIKYIHIWGVPLFEGMVFCRNNGWIMCKIWTRDSLYQNRCWYLAKNTPNDPEFICPVCLPKSSGFHWKKASLGVCIPWSKQYSSMQIKR